MTFAERHAKIDPDPVVEMARRLQMWAGAPASNGGALQPSASIVPDETLRAAIAELNAWRATAKIKPAGSA